MRKKLTALIFCLAISMAGFAHYYFVYSRQSALLNDANIASEKNDLDKAISLLQKYVKENPNNDLVKTKLNELNMRFKKRFLLLAQNKIKNGENQAAIKAYENHIKHYPDDFAAQFLLIDLYTTLKIYWLAEQRLNTLLQKPVLNKDTQRAANNQLNTVINTWANALKRQADKATALGNTNDAIQLYTQVIQLRAKNPSLITATADWSIAIRAFDDAVSRRAFVVWRATDLEQAQTLLLTEFDASIFNTADLYERNKEQQLRYRQELLAQLLWEHADSLFDAQLWEHAYATYEQAKFMHRASTGEEFDAAIASMQFNQVISKLRLQLNKDAIQLFEKIRAAAPYYEPIKMRELAKALAFPEDRPPLPATD